tara:strand:- start:20 stop:229 length:210 start_codon:yes stop_codon:yes gene_type:complete
MENEEVLDKNQTYRRNYYLKNREKIQKYQKEYYRKYIKKDKVKKRQPAWRGEPIKHMTIERKNIIIKFD